MKRLLAALLTLSMLVGIVPFSAFAESPGAVPETFAAAQESPGLDDETVQSIVSDPLLQGQYAPPQQAQPTVDTSNMSMEATDSFGKLLVNSIDEQNSASSSENRVIGVTVDGSTATVEYVAAEDADIVVALYTDDSEELMSASGTAPAFVTEDNTGSSTATVSLTGSIPNSFVVKAFLLDTVEHAPLSNEFTSSAYTKDIQDLENATVDDYPADRVLNLDEQNDTNFAVVKDDVVLVSDNDSSFISSYAANTHPTSLIDNGDGSYTITTSNEKIKKMTPGEIFAYQQNNAIFVLRIETLNIVGDSVTITGDDALDLIDVFDVVKIESTDDGSQLEYDGTGVDEEVHYNGLVKEQDSLDETNAFSDDVTFSFAHKFVIGTDTFYDGEKKDEDDTHITTKFGINAVLNLKLSTKFQYLIAADKQNFSCSLESEASGGVEVSYNASTKIDLGFFKKSLPGIYINYTPQLVFKFDITGEFYYTLTTKQGFSCDGHTITDTSEKPVVEFSIKVSGTLYIGVEFAPSIKVGFYKFFKARTEENFLSLLELEVAFSIGAEGTIEPTVEAEVVEPNKIISNYSGNSIHECNACLSGDIYSKVGLTVTVKIIKVWSTTETLLDYRSHILTLYYSINYNDFGSGKCPHKLYLVNISADSIPTPSGVEVFSTDENGKEQSIGSLLGSIDNYCYMRPGTYTLKSTISGNSYSCIFTVTNSNIDVSLKADNNNSGSSGDSEKDNLIAFGTYGDNLTWQLDNNGVLTIYGDGPMAACAVYWMGEGGGNGYYESSSPWFKYIDKIKTVNIPSSITSIGYGAFFANEGTAKIDTVNYAGTRTQWENLQIEAWNDLLLAANVICSDDIQDDTVIASGTCGANGSQVFWKLDENGTLTISGRGKTDDFPNPNYSAYSTPWDDYKDSIQSIIVKDGITYLGTHAFRGCENLISVSLPSSVTGIAESVFSVCRKLKSIKLPDSIEYIGGDAFSSTGLTSINIPDGVTAIGSSAFYWCFDLSEVIIPDSVQEINPWTFCGCKKLTNITLSSGITMIGEKAFLGCKNLTNITLPSSIKKIDVYAFDDCGLTSVNYEGTKSQWNEIVINSLNQPLTSSTIHCTDGDIIPTSTVSSEENDIFPSTATGNDHSFAASFSDLTPGVSYAVIVSRSEIDLLAPENLIYINQFRATSSGYQQSFQTPRSSALNSDDMTYVIASGIYSFDEAPTPTPTPGGGSSSGGGGGGGGGAAVLIGVGAAAAITAGVIMMSPVEIKGRVVLADQAAVPGAKISLLREGKVVAQTTADENGSFSLKAKRGSYELTAAYTTADGQLIYKTIDIKAPAKDLTVTF